MFSKTHFCDASYQQLYIDWHPVQIRLFINVALVKKNHLDLIDGLAISTCQDVICDVLDQPQSIGVGIIMSVLVKIVITLCFVNVVLPTSKVTAKLADLRKRIW